LVPQDVSGFLRNRRGAEPLDDRRKDRGQDGEIVRRAPGTTQCLPDRGERVRVVIVPTDVLEQGQKMVEGGLVIDSSFSPCPHSFSGSIRDSKVSRGAVEN
jgi:hypothetical protein